MGAKTRSLTFNGNTITFLRWGKLWVLPAKLLGQALGYSSNGDKLANLITGGWKKGFKFTVTSTKLGLEDAEAVLLKKEALAIFKKLSGQETKAPQMLILTMAGVIRVLGKSRAKMAESFKDFLAKNGGELIKGLELQPSQGGSSALDFKKDLTPLDGLLKVAELMKGSKVISKKNQEVFINKIADVAMVDFQKKAGLTNFVKDPLVPATETKALEANAMSVPEGNFNVVSTERPQHPDYQDWLPASDIGAPWLLKGEFIKKFVKKFCDARGIDLPNNDAKKFVSSNDNKFPIPDKKGFIIYKPPHGLGIALYMQMEGNQMNWRNYWSPAAVELIRELVALEKGIPIPNIAMMVKMEILGNIFRELDVLKHSMRLDSAESAFRDQCRKKNVRFDEDETMVKDFLDSKSVSGGPLLRWKHKGGDAKLVLYTPVGNEHPFADIWELDTPKVVKDSFLNIPLHNPNEMWSGEKKTLAATTVKGLENGKVPVEEAPTELGVQPQD